MRFTPLAIYFILGTTFSLGCADNGFKGEASLALRSALNSYAELQFGGGWATQYSEDLSRRWGDWQPVIPEIVTVQQPGTPMVGLAFLRGYQALGEEKYLQAARRAGDLLVKGQDRRGGYSYELWISPDGPVAVYQSKPMADPMPFDRRGLSDGVTDSALQLLLALFDQTADSTYFKAARLGADFYLESQYPNGAWPMEYPPPAGAYAAYYTLNDGVINDTVCRLIEFYRRTGAKNYLQAALAGGDWLIEAQMGPPTYAWAEQYDFDMKPAKARIWEVPAVCPRACGWAMEALLALYLQTGEPKYYRSVERVVGWLEKAELAPGFWSRNYDYRTGEPFYVDGEGKRLADPQSIRSQGGSFGLKPLLADYYELTRIGREAFLDESERALDGEELSARIDSLRVQARRAVESLHPDGFWVGEGEGELIRSRTFFYNVLALADYIQGGRGLKPRGINPPIRDYAY